VALAAVVNATRALKSPGALKSETLPA